MSFAAPFFPQDTRFLGGVTFDVEAYPLLLQHKARQRRNLPESYYKYRFDDVIKQTIATHPGPIYIMAVPWEMIVSPITLERYGLKGKRQNCIFFNASINNYSRGWELCRVEKIVSSPQ